MYKLDLPVDTREAAAREARQNRETQRKSRIFDARTRQMGVDTEALTAQIAEKELLKQAEREGKAAYDADMLKTAQICTLLDKRQNDDVKEVNKQLNKFRLEQQTVGSRREFDIYDPQSKKKDQPARVGDDDPRCHVSGLQLFQGEDLSEKERKKLQQEQMREWIKQQLQEKNRESAAEAYAEQLHQKKMIEIDARAAQLARDEEECRRNLNMAAKDYNSALAKEKKAQEELNRQKELDDNFTELSNQVFGDTLTENPAVAQSSFGAHRVIPDRWKGMSQEEIAAILHTRECQNQEKQKKDEEDAQIHAEFERMQLLQAHTAILMERQADRASKELEKSIAEENMRIMQEQRSTQTHLNKEVYTNPPTDEFFAQFNTSTR